MKRTARDRRGTPRPKPVERIELNEDHVGRRLVIAGALLILGAGLLAYAVMGLLAPETGWQTIQASSSAGPTCAGDFTLLYEVRSTQEAKGVTALYTSICQKAFQLFHSGEAFEDVTNLHTINSRPNEVLEVDGALYEAFALVTGNGRRELYLGPVYSRYGDLFFCQDDVQLVDFDPRLSEEVRREYEEILTYANDPHAIRLELLGENRVRLNVSEEYLAWAEGDVPFIDFAWMENAFVADYLAAGLAAEGYTRGTLSSYDGFTRNLDSGEYAYPLYHREGDTIYSAAELQYRGPMSLVRMRDYPLGGQDFQRYYELRTGEIRTFYLDTADALCKSAVDTLVCYSGEKGCAQLLLEMIPVYIADAFREEAVAALAGKGIQSIYCRDTVVLHTDPAAILTNFYGTEKFRYTAEQITP